MTADVLSKPVSLAGHHDPTAVLAGGLAALDSHQSTSLSAAAEKARRGKKTRPTSVPESELLELTGQAELHNQRIVESEVSAVDDYWLLGRVLERVRGNFPRGRWHPWLARRNIDRTRAKRARLLADVFAATEEMAGLTVHEALAIARLRKKALSGGPRETRLQKQLKSAVKKLLDISADLVADDLPRQYSALAAELAEATAAICRACSTAEGPQSPPARKRRKKPR